MLGIERVLARIADLRRNHRAEVDELKRRRAEVEVERARSEAEARRYDAEQELFRKRIRMYEAELGQTLGEEGENGC